MNFCPRCDSEDCRCGSGADPGFLSVGAAAAETEPNEAAEDRVGRVLQAPSKPMAVARELVKELYTEHDRLHLRTYRGDSYRWDGTCWPEVEPRSVRESVYRYVEHAVYIKNNEEEPWDPTRYKIDNVIDALRAVTHLDGTVEAPAWTNGAADLPPHEVVAMNNGLLHVPTRTLLRHTPDFWSHHSVPFDFDPKAPTATRWTDFLGELFESDTDAIDTDAIAALQEAFGYILGTDTRQQKIFLIVGPKRGGKGTIGRVLTGLLGRHNIAAPTLAGLATNFGLSPLIGKPLGLVSDARLSGKADSNIVVERLLSISGEDSITIDRKYKDPWTGRLPTRFLVLTNELPRLTDSSGALASRFVLFVLTKSFYGREDPMLSDKLLEEAPGILNWALEGYDRLNERGYFKPPASSAEAIQQLEDLASPVAAFVRESCTLGSNRRVSVDDLWNAWKSWCESDNRHPGTKAVFGRDLKAASPTVRKARPRDDHDRTYAYLGIGLNRNNNGPDLGPPGPGAGSRPRSSSGPSGPRDHAMYSQHRDKGPVHAAHGNSAMRSTDTDRALPVGEIAETFHAVEVEKAGDWKERH